MDTYQPIIRHGMNEQKSLESIHNNFVRGGNSNRVSQIEPFIEIIDDNYMNNIPDYASKYHEVFVDLPRYLIDRDNKHNDDVTQLASSYSNNPSRFHLQQSNQNYTPVISGTLDPIAHSDFDQFIQNLSSDFDRLATRFFVPIDKYTNQQKQEIRDALQELRAVDRVIADVPDVDNLSNGVRPNIEFLKQEISGQELFVSDIFEPRNGVNYNYSLVMAKYIDADGICDFTLEPRFPQDIPPEAFANIPKRIHHYKTQNHGTTTTEDSDHYVNVVEKMLQNGDLDPAHCPACDDLHDEYQTVRTSSSRTDIGTNFVKQKRINHYVYSLLDDEFRDMASATDAQSFDPNGYADII